MASSAPLAGGSIRVGLGDQRCFLIPRGMHEEALRAWVDEVAGACALLAVENWDEDFEAALRESLLAAGRRRRDDDPELSVAVFALFMPSVVSVDVECRSDRSLGELGRDVERVTSGGLGDGLYRLHVYDGGSGDRQAAADAVVSGIFLFADGADSVTVTTSPTLVSIYVMLRTVLPPIVDTLELTRSDGSRFRATLPADDDEAWDLPPTTAKASA